MMKVNRKNPTLDKKAIVEKQMKIKTFSYNSNGNFFIIYNDAENKNEMLICLSSSEFQQLKSFMERIK